VDCLKGLLDEGFPKLPAERVYDFGHVTQEFSVSASS
jgi:hypothetical protein